MNFSDIKNILIKIEPFIALGIFVMLLTLSILLYNEQIITKKISENCGWGEEDFFCVCEKSKALEMRNIMDGKEVSFENVTLDK